MKKSSFLMALILSSAAVSASAEKANFIFSPFTDAGTPGQTQFTVQTKEYIMAGVLKKSTVGEVLMEFAYKPADSTSDIAFCTTLTSLGVKDGNLVLKLRDYTVTAPKTYLELFMKEGRVSANGTFVCRVGKLFSENLNEIIYIPKDTAFALPDRLVGYAMTIKLEDNLEMVPTLK